MTSAGTRPVIEPLGLDRMLVIFGDRLSEPANRAALAYAAMLSREAPGAVEEVATTMVSVLVRFDPLHPDAAALPARLAHLGQQRDWTDASLPEGRRLWRIPTVYGGDHGPQLNDAAGAAGLSPETAITELGTSRVRVQALGFGPGQPYLGALPGHWDIPRLSDITPRVPAGALVVAVRQFVLFSAANSTGWRHVARTAIPLFRPESDTPFTLRPGDEAVFEAVSPETFERCTADPMGGAVAEVLK